MPKVVVNSCYGGFGISEAAILRYSEIKGLNLAKVEDDGWYSWCINGINDAEHRWHYHDIERTDPILVQVVEELGADANDWAASLRIADVPDDAKWYIDDYDGIETIREEHRTW